MIDEKQLEIWRESPKRTEWHESAAYDRFSDLEMQFPNELRDRARMGALLIQTMQGLEGLHCWIAPIEGYPKLLSPKSQVKIFDRDGAAVYEGLWNLAPFEFLKANEEFFIWLAMREGAVAPPRDWRTRIVGAWRWASHFLSKGRRERK